MHAYRNKTRTQYGQVVESVVELLSDVSVDPKDKYYVFKHIDTDVPYVRIHSVDGMLQYNIYDAEESSWGQDIPLTLGDENQIKNLPIYPDVFNDDTYARMDTSFHLYKEGTEYVRVEQGSPNKIFYTSAIAFQRQGDANPKLTIDTSLTTSAYRLDMSSQRISSLADPTSATDAVNRQYADELEVPIGTVLAYYANSTPNGFLYCDGSVFNTSEFPQLFALLGSNVLPDLRGMFLRGTSSSNTVDPDGPRNVGSMYTDAFKSHSHYYLDVYQRENTLGGSNNLYGENSGDYDNSDLYYTRTTASTGELETRPKNVAIRFIIKAKLRRNI